MLVWSITKKEKKKKKKVYKSKQESITTLSNFLLLIFFLCFTFICVIECFSFLAQLHNYYIYIVEVIDELHMNFVLSILKLNLEASLYLFRSKNWILLVVSIDDCFCKSVYTYVIYILLVIHNGLVWTWLGKGGENSGLEKERIDDVALLPIQRSYPPFVWSFFSVETMKSDPVLVFRFDHSSFFYVLLVFSILFIYFIFHV